jgi:hypothetical protein
MGRSHVPEGRVCGNSGGMGSSWGQSWPLDPRACLTALAGKERVPLTLLAEGLGQTGGAGSGWLVAMVRDQGELLTMTDCTVECGTSGKLLTISVAPRSIFHGPSQVAVWVSLLLQEDGWASPVLSSLLTTLHPTDTPELSPPQAPQ